MRRLKIAIVCFNLEWQAGGPRLIFSQAHALKKIGHRVILYAPKVDAAVYPELQRGIDIREIATPPLIWHYSSKSMAVRVKEKIQHELRMVRVAKAIAQAMDDDFDIVNLHDYAYKTAPFYKKKGRGIVMWTMNEPPIAYLPKPRWIYDVASRLFNLLREFTEKVYFKQVDGAVVVVKRYKQWLEQRGLVGRIIWTGVDLEKFNSSAKVRDSKPEIRLLGLGALHPYRRFEDLIYATKILREKEYPVRATIVSRNIWKEDGYKKELEAIVEKENLQDIVRLNFNGVSESELPDLYTTHDIFLSLIHTPPPRNGYGWQMVIFEAMASGIPTLLCATNDATEALRDKENALFVSPTDPNDVAEKAASLIDNPAYYNAVAERGRNFVHAHMSWDTYASRFLDFFYSLTEKT